MISWWWLLSEAGVIGGVAFLRWMQSARLTDEQIKIMLSMYEQKVLSLKHVAERESRNERSAAGLDSELWELKKAQARVSKLNKALAKRDGRQNGELSLVKGEDDGC